MFGCRIMFLHLKRIILSPRHFSYVSNFNPPHSELTISAIHSFLPSNPHDTSIDFLQLTLSLSSMHQSLTLSHPSNLAPNATHVPSVTLHSVDTYQSPFIYFTSNSISQGMFAHLSKHSHIRYSIFLLCFFIKVNILIHHKVVLV